MTKRLIEGTYAQPHFGGMRIFSGVKYSGLIIVENGVFRGAVRDHGYTDQRRDFRKDTFANIFGYLTSEAISFIKRYNDNNPNNEDILYLGFREPHKDTKLMKFGGIWRIPPEQPLKDDLAYLTNEMAESMGLAKAVNELNREHNTGIMIGGFQCHGGQGGFGLEVENIPDLPTIDEKLIDKYCRIEKSRRLKTG